MRVLLTFQSDPIHWQCYTISITPRNNTLAFLWISVVPRAHSEKKSAEIDSREKSLIGSSNCSRFHQPGRWQPPSLPLEDFLTGFHSPGTPLDELKAQRKMKSSSLLSWQKEQHLPSDLLQRWSNSTDIKAVRSKLLLPHIIFNSRSRCLSAGYPVPRECCDV